MKKIITTVVFLVFSTISAKAIDFSPLSLTGGLSTNASIFTASAVQDAYSETDTLKETNKESGVFADGFASQFVELGIGRWISIGIDQASDTLATPEITTREGRTNENKVSVDFNDFDTKYIKLNIPGGMYVKYGTVGTDLDIKEVMASGNTYSNISIEGTSMGLGYQKLFGDSGFGFRFEGNHIELDDATANNGVTTGTITNSGKNIIKVSKMEGATAKFALTYTLVRNN